MAFIVASGRVAAGHFTVAGKPKKIDTGSMPMPAASAPIVNAISKAREPRLRDLAGVGSAIEADLRLLGVISVSELARQSGDELYEKLCRVTGMRQDVCVLDVFRCAVAQARDANLPAERRNWWWWSRQRKSGTLG
jgi:hypothetical protein